MTAAVRIGEQDGSEWLGFDLREVLDAVGPHEELAWVLYDAQFNGDVRTVWPEGWESVQRRSDMPGGVPLTWQEMQTLGATCQQIIDGRFTGYDEAGHPLLQVQAVDSSYWIIWAQDAAILERVRGRFVVEDYEEPPPEAAPGGGLVT